MRLMELFELDKLSNPDESNAYTLLTPQGKEDPAANTQYFETERGTKYEIFFNPMTQPPATEVMFGVVEMGGTINFGKAYTSGPQEVVKIFNNVIKATLAYDQAQDWGVPVWFFSSTGASRTRMYERLAHGIAGQTNSKVFKIADWGQTIFLVYQNTPQGKAKLKQCIDFYNEFKDEKDMIKEPEGV